MASGSVRVDAWLWAVRLYKTRSAATAACRAGHVELGGERVKAAQSIVPGDRIRVRKAGREFVYEVRRTISKRVGAAAAAECFIDHSPPPPPPAAFTGLPQRERGAGRPTKKERREIERLRGRN